MKMDINMNTLMMIVGVMAVAIIFLVVAVIGLVLVVV